MTHDISVDDVSALNSWFDKRLDLPFSKYIKKT